MSDKTLLHRPYRNNEPPLLEVFDERNGVLFEVGQAAVNGLGVIVRPPLLLGSFVQPLLQVEVGAGQEHHQVRSADLPGNRGLVKHDSQTHTVQIALDHQRDLEGAQTHSCRMRSQIRMSKLQFTQE